MAKMLSWIKVCCVAGIVLLLKSSLAFGCLEEFDGEFLYEDNVYQFVLEVNSRVNEEIWQYKWNDYYDDSSYKRVILVFFHTNSDKNEFYLVEKLKQFLYNALLVEDIVKIGCYDRSFDYDRVLVYAY